MRIFRKRISPFVLSVSAVICATVIICAAAFCCCTNRIYFETEFFFVCYRAEDNAVSASSVSEAVSSYGGAGYILEYGDVFYVTISCYYTKPDADGVCETLKKRNFNCEVLKVSTGDYTVNSRSKKNNKLYLGNLNTLVSLSSVAYECANRLDTGEYLQAQAISVVEEIKTALGGLLSANKDNCFTTPLRRLIAECTESGDGFIYSKNMRKLQIAIADAVINADLY